MYKVAQEKWNICAKICSVVALCAEVYFSQQKEVELVF